MNRQTLLWIVAALLAFVVGATFQGCKCSWALTEGFAAPDAAMSPEETKLFDELRSDKYSADQIDHMVSSGVIDQKLVEKFLDKLEDVDVPAPKANVKSA